MEGKSAVVTSTRKKYSDHLQLFEQNTCKAQ